MSKKLSALFFLLLSCGDLPETYISESIDEKSISGIEIYLSADRMEAGTAAAAELLFIKAGGVKESVPVETASWESDNESIASVDSRGVVTGLAAGSAVIRAGYLEFTDEIRVRVYEEIARGDLIISEALCDPDGTDTGREFIEIFNASDKSIDLSGAGLVDGAPSSKVFYFPEGAGLEPGETAVVGQDSALFTADYGRAPDYAGLPFTLNNTGETIFLRKRGGEIIDEVYIKGGSSGFPAPESWGSSQNPSPGSGISAHRDRGNITFTREGWTTGPPSPGE
jgi:hypothetical protein